jgi:2-dehydro-3-deoxygalactonokinase
MGDAAALIAMDWGTTSCRAALLSLDGQLLAQRDGGKGILAIANGTFETELQTFLAPWHGGKTPPRIILSGMIGSKQGWHEASYVRCPAGLSDIAAHLTWIDSAVLGRIALVPGLDDQASGTPDVMRGEETQIVGALGTGSGLCVLPGTHSKWATVTQGRITGFGSYMTGEVFAALKDHTILGRLMTTADIPDEAAFLRGVRDGAAAGGPGALLNRIFATRTLGLFNRLPPTALADYLSGLLIGAEVADNASEAPVVIIGNAALTRRYASACQALGRVVSSAPPDCAARGAYAIARAAGMIELEWIPPDSGQVDRPRT